MNEKQINKYINAKTIIEFTVYNLEGESVWFDSVGCPEKDCEDFGRQTAYYLDDNEFVCLSCNTIFGLVDLIATKKNISKEEAIRWINEVINSEEV